MSTNKNALTFGAVETIAHHRYQLEQKLDSIRRGLAGRDRPLLPENWTDADAWELARDLSSLMAQVYRLNKTVFDRENPYPSHDTPLGDIRYFNPYFPEDDPFAPPELPEALWAEVLHCGILAAAGNASFCFPSSGTFADLEELFLGVTRSGGGPVLTFHIVLNQLGSALGDYERLQAFGFGPEPPRFGPPEDALEEAHQGSLTAYWEEWDWLNRFPCRSELMEAIDRLEAEEMRGQVETFVQSYIGMDGLLRQAVDLYLYREGASGMLEDSYFATYALLSRAQKQLRALLTEEEG